MKSEEQIKAAVRQRYGQLAARNEGSCCGESQCCSADETDLPSEALSVVASCGSPLTRVEIREGETVLDLGSGGGVDVFRASKLVGENGKVIGLDATPEMIFRARETAKKHGYRNVEFRLGEIEHMPIESNSMDLVISNCVLNLVPDKRLGFNEIYRVLRPGGRISISDMVAVEQLTPEERANLDDWSECIAGAITVDEYKRLLLEVGFANLSTISEGDGKVDRVKSMTWLGEKPHG
jgi:SAM-dependent methyltransferase